ncbi:peptidase [Mangrovihabitans endophyticus]|uniref:Zn-dependent protease n=1 Tax=Mangrovihabitans endophyticus TaxID=1751298 RepID=A0A8J3C150_9ACTN|nr:peptidase [Mangrovihabitans endophyticus]GGL02278.1 Zn-dependent protease [Mangrovihabitans endophyticus]
MSGGVRARASVLTLAGFPVVATLQLALVVAPVLLLLSLLPGPLALRVGGPVCMATVGVMAYATWRALHARRVPPAGVPVSRDDAPALWTMVEDAARAAATRPPDGIVVIAEARVTLHERGRLLGLLGGRRELYLGMPPLLVWDGAWLAAAVAHEMAHGSPTTGGRFARVAHRGRLTVGRVVPRISHRNPAGPLLRAYARWYRAVDAPLRRDAELAADRMAAAFAGGPAAVAVLRDLPALQRLQRVFHAEYLGPGWQAGCAPDDIFGGFLRMLAARAEEMAALRAQEPAPPGFWDTHPPAAQRRAAIDTTTAGSVRLPDGDLVPDLPGLGRALQEVSFPAAGRVVVTWDEFFGAARSAEMRREADAALGALSHTVGTIVRTAADVLDLAADGRLGKAAEGVFGDLAPDERSERVIELITLLLALAALDGGAARWRHSWTGTAELVARDGSHLDLRGPAVQASDPATVGTARARLADAGIDPAASGGTSEPRPVVLSGVVNLVVDGARTDLLVAESGLLLVPGLPRGRHGAAKHRLARFAAGGEAAPNGRFVPYAEISGAIQRRRTRRAWDLRLRDGGALSVRTALDSDELPGGWRALDDALAFLARPR